MKKKKKKNFFNTPQRNHQEYKSLLPLASSPSLLKTILIRGEEGEEEIGSSEMGAAGEAEGVPPHPAREETAEVSRPPCGGEEVGGPGSLEPALLPKETPSWLSFCRVGRRGYRGASSPVCCLLPA